MAAPNSAAGLARCGRRGDDRIARDGQGRALDPHDHRASWSVGDGRRVDEAEADALAAGERSHAAWPRAQLPDTVRVAPGDIAGQTVASQLALAAEPDGELVAGDAYEVNRSGLHGRCEGCGGERLPGPESGGDQEDRGSAEGHAGPVSLRHERLLTAGCWRGRRCGRSGRKRPRW